MKRAVLLAFTLSAIASPAFAADAVKPEADQSAVVTPQRVDVDLEPAGVAPGTTVRQARIAQNWLILGLGAAALAGIIFGLSSSDSDSTTTTN